MYLIFEIQVEIILIIDLLISYRLAPEYPYPNPTDDCFAATQYVIKNPSEFGADLNKFIIAGDSAGGNAVAVVTQRLLREKSKLPKLQILIYPWLQMFTFHLPSMMRYSNSGLLKATQVDLIHFVSWYLGIEKIMNKEIENNLLVNNHTLLIEDLNLRKK